MIWDVPHKHIIKTPVEKYTTLSYKKSKNIIAPLLLAENLDIQQLFMMTPYYRKAPKEKQDNILKLETLDTQAHFTIDILDK